MDATIPEVSTRATPSNRGDAGRTIGQIFEDMPLTARHWQAGLTLFLVLVIEAWEMMVIVLGSSHISKDLGINDAQVGLIVGAIFLGMIPGALIWGKLIDRWGRNQTTVRSLVLYGLVSLASAFSPTFEVLWVLRFVSGLALSGTIVCTFLYFEELLPIHARGKATVYLAAGWPLGLLVSIGAAQLLGDLGWRWMIGASSVAALWAIVVRRAVPESPYWLCEQGRNDEARAVLARLSGDANMLKVKIVDPVVAAGSAIGRGSIFELFNAQHVKITLLQYIIGFCYSWGYWGLSGMMPVLLAKRGLTTPQGYGFMALSALCMFPGYISASYFTGKFGRKLVMLIYVFGSTVAGFGLAYSSSLTQMYVSNFALSFFSLGAWGIWNTWLGEIYDTRLRGVGYSSGMAVQRIANTFAPVVVGAMAAHSSFTDIVASITMFLGATLVALLFLPETEGHALE